MGEENPTRKSRPDPTQLDPVAEKKRAYELELKRKKFLNGIYLGASILGAVVLLVIFSSGNFGFLMGSIGINFSNEETGIYADCTKRENRKSVYCQPKESASDAQWKDIRTTRGKAVPFNLH